MASRVSVYLGLSDRFVNDQSDVIGVDYGAYFCAQQKKVMKLAIGDFDSVNREEESTIAAFAQTVVHLNAHKDMTDFQAALAYCQPYDEIFVYGALGGRIDHQWINMELMKRDERIVLFDATNECRLVRPGTYTIEKHRRYLSILPQSDALVSLSGVSYPLDHRSISPADLYLTSNEILDERAQLTLHSGTIVLVQAEDKKKTDH